MNLNFKGLQDDQLLQLIQGALAEAVSRGGAIAAAARTEFVDASERARIEAEALLKAQAKAAEQERERIQAEAERKAQAAIKSKQEQEYATTQAKNWGMKKAIHLALQEWGVQEDHKLTVWERDGDKRIYFQEDNSRRSIWKVTYYITGNIHHAPGELNWEYMGRADDERLKNLSENKADQKALIRFFEAVSDRWESLNSSSSSALTSKVDVFEKHITAYREALSLTVEVADV